MNLRYTSLFSAMDPRFPFTLLPLFFFAFFLPLLSSPSQASVFTVGDSRGWVVGIVNYTLWASNHTFFVGDYLVFNYVPEFHSVMEVSKAAYENCETVDVMAEHNDGNTSVHLEREGTYYYICGTQKHCSLGQKLEVTVSSPPPPSPQEEDNTSMAPSPSPLLSAPSALHHAALSSPLSSSSSMTYLPPFPLFPLTLFPLFIFLLYTQHL